MSIKLELNKNENIYKTFFSNDEEIAEDNRFYSLLTRTIISYSILCGRIAILFFKNGITASIENFGFNEYRMIISDDTIYEYQDDSHTKMSRDRVIHYLDYIADINTLK